MQILPCSGHLFLTADSLPSLEIISKQKLRELSNASRLVLEKRTVRLVSNAQSNVLEHMREAARLLRETQKHITEITILVGYDNANYFSRIFKKQYGTSPSEYRRGSECY